ncbi:methylated-DNA--[protein]-cysteine S-methyltransferase [Nesterenkonia alba]|uniref:methylated-DNA--[protein]-cysteine S-methyltransferase n=1 Tax=Nesterenkonia alba TaxID=515814 RepID=UPI0003B7A074|nr:methylated-DNA--[protein]-cysteine S-methyltransferase [Nesterenkonia alba]
MNGLSSGQVTTADGIFTVVADDAHVVASGWTQDLETLVALIHPRLRADLTSHTSPVVQEAVKAVVAYYDGDVSAPAQIPVRQHSGPFRERAWEVLRAVEPGAPLTYTEYATRIGNPTAARAAASACAMNAAALFVPCHRIIRTDGTLGGFRYGLDLKARLLSRETQRRQRSLS